MAGSRLWHTSDDRGSVGYVSVSSPASTQEMDVNDIRDDEGINALRDARNSLEVLARMYVEMRNTVKAQAERIEELEEVNASMHDRLSVMGDARNQGVSITPRQADWVATAYEEVAKYMEVLDSIPEPYVMAEANRKAQCARWHRIANSALKRIWDGHTALAEQLLLTLTEELDDGQADDRTTDDSSEARPQSSGTPYLFDWPEPWPRS